MSKFPDKNVGLLKELLAESTSNNTSMNINDESSNSSNGQIQNVSFTSSPPAPNSAISKFSPQPSQSLQQLPLQPPPLPPLPPSLVSKYGLNRNFSIEPESVKQQQQPPTQQSIQPINNVIVETNVDQIDPSDPKNFIKCTNTYNEFDVLFKGIYL